MRARYLILGSTMLASSLAACATTPRASADETPGYAVLENALDYALKADCGGERYDRRDAVSVPVALVVRPDGSVDPGSVRVTSVVRPRNRTTEEVRRIETNLRSDAVSRAGGCTFTQPLRNGQPVYARVRRTITIPLSQG